ncbi:DCC1-like thiol-disulfide oxidoreductase family protein [Coraliomargarita sp. SDUM461004]|uniref:DCC1-like thiol-disulfide oxidoreductase family protein n=1 Tax=Thalassobacterium sedimentorum TaxID=3041258 RepID=A0ABU1AM50_9BACT|nr:DCC1-like thiol-disulfide oxidoreductase family protein [Coraliomargarita sp. SDUM461004]MDQ8194678.1 DCC1-like thiol-disulfide oxidoreductase family protein [Coraliomargarita sp. SDUM461004]
MKPSSPAILFYDGDCGLCNRAVHVLLRQDRGERLYFAPIQGVTAQECLPIALRSTLSTVVYQRPNSDGTVTTWTRSEALLCALIDLQGSLRWPATISRWLPISWRDAVYNWIARNRHHWGKRQVCAVPSPSERMRFLP